MSGNCDKCGKLVPDGEASCPNCGTKIEMDNLAVGCLFVLGLIDLLYLIFRYWQVIILVAAVLLVAAGVGAKLFAFAISMGFCDCEGRWFGQ